jgi:YVTN family beta-propeller protein
MILRNVFDRAPLTGRALSYAVAMAEANGSSPESDPPRTGVGARPPPDSRLSDAAVRTFLIADVRGYTRFTQEHGDEPAGRLAAAFAELSRSAVKSHGGEVIELRGDEALCVFGSARQALRAAVELQTSFRRQADDGPPAFPLPIGIGLDAGEAVPIEGGYRGGALNTASRLCSLARPGEILATETVVSLARRLEGIRFVERRPVRLKGLEKPVRVIEVRPDPALPPPPQLLEKQPFVTTRRMVVGAVAGLGLLALVVLGVLGLTGEEDVVVRPDSVAVIDPSSNEVVDSIPVGESPGPITFAGGALWVANLNSRTLSKVDPRTRMETETVGLGGASGSESLTPRLAGDDDDLWVANDCFRELLRMDPENGNVGQSLTLRGLFGSRSFYSCALTAAPGSVWIAVDTPYQLLRVRETADEPASIAQRIPLPVGVRTGIALGAGSVWVSERINLTKAGAIRRIEPETGAIVKTIPVDEGTEAIVFAYGSIWVVNASENSLLRILPQTNAVVREIPVGQGPSAIAAGAGALWVANTDSGTVSRIDPETRSVTKTIELGHRPLGLIVHDGLVWVTVRE